MFILRVANCKQWTLNLWVLIAWSEDFVWSLMVRSRISRNLLNLNLYFTRMIHSRSQRINFLFLWCILIILNRLFSILLFLLQYISILGMILARTLLFVYKVNVEEFIKFIFLTFFSYATLRMVHNSSLRSDVALRRFYKCCIIIISRWSTSMICLLNF
mgnify:CR=1 FL=1